MSPFIVLVAFPALAAEPQVDLDANGMIVGRILVPANAAEVHEVLDDPVACGHLSSDIVSVQSTPSNAHAPSSRCQDVVTETRGLFHTLFMRSRRCPTADGWEDQLVQSDDFDAYETRWSLKEVEGGTEVTMSVRTEVDLPVPTSVVQSHQKKTVGEVLENLLYQVLH